MNASHRNGHSAPPVEPIWRYEDARALAEAGRRSPIARRAPVGDALPWARQPLYRISEAATSANHHGSSGIVALIRGERGGPSGW